MVFTAKLGTLTPISPRLGNDCPELVDYSRDSISFYPKIRHPPGVDYVLRRDEKFNLSVSWNTQRFVNFEKLGLRFDLAILYLRPRSRQI